MFVWKEKYQSSSEGLYIWDSHEECWYYLKRVVDYHSLIQASKFCIGKMMLYWPSSLLHFFTSSCNENLLLFYICPHSAQVFTCINDTTRSPYWSPHQPLGHFQWAHLLLFRSKSNVCSTLDHVCKLVVWCLC